MEFARLFVMTRAIKSLQGPSSRQGHILTKRLVYDDVFAYFGTKSRQSVISELYKVNGWPINHRLIKSYICVGLL